MYLGKLVEVGPTAELIDAPQHPYTTALVDSIPEPEPQAAAETDVLSGDVPDPAAPPSGCSFHPRCPRVIPPEDYAFADGVFRRLLDLRVALAEEAVDPDSFDSPTAVRSAFDLPATLRDEEAEAVLDDAVRTLLGGEADDARDRLADAFGTVCERREPQLRETDVGHPAACHLYSCR
jgi:peptide/nickel transport system ATP-binding protein